MSIYSLQSLEDALQNAQIVAKEQMRTLEGDLDRLIPHLNLMKKQNPEFAKKFARALKFGVRNM